jgi:hypothetical protein
MRMDWYREATGGLHGHGQLTCFNPGCAVRGQISMRLRYAQKMASDRVMQSVLGKVESCRRDRDKSGCIQVNVSLEVPIGTPCLTNRTFLFFTTYHTFSV